MNISGLKEGSRLFVEQILGIVDIQSGLLTTNSYRWVSRLFENKNVNTVMYDSSHLQMVYKMLKSLGKINYFMQK